MALVPSIKSPTLSSRRVGVERVAQGTKGGSVELDGMVPEETGMPARVTSFLAKILD